MSEVLSKIDIQGEQYTYNPSNTTPDPVQYSEVAFTSRGAYNFFNLTGRRSVGDREIPIRSWLGFVYRDKIGRVWRKASTPGASNFTRAYFGNDVWIAFSEVPETGIHTIYRSTDYGINWLPVYTFTNPYSPYAPAAGNNIWVVPCKNEASTPITYGYLYSIDSGATWHFEQTEQQVTSVVYGWVMKRFIMAYGNQGLKYSDDGCTWQATNITTGTYNAVGFWGNYGAVGNQLLHFAAAGTDDWIQGQYRATASSTYGPFTLNGKAFINAGVGSNTWILTDSGPVRGDYNRVDGYYANVTGNVVAGWAYGTGNQDACFLTRNNASFSLWIGRAQHWNGGPGAYSEVNGNVPSSQERACCMNGYFIFSDGDKLYILNAPQSASLSEQTPIPLYGSVRHVTYSHGTCLLVTNVGIYYSSIELFM